MKIRAPNLRPRRTGPRAAALVPAAAVLLAAALPRSSARADVPREPAPLTALVGATVWDGTGRGPLPNAVILIERDRITTVGSRARVKVPKEARVIDVAGRYVIPGLVDAHVHLFQSGGLYTRPDVIDLRAARPYPDEVQAIKAELDDTFRRYLVSGVTAIVDVGGPVWNFEARARADKALLAPRVAATGPLISTVARPQLDAGDAPILRAASADEARAMVRAQIPFRPAFIKIWFVATPERSLDELRPIVRAAIDEAHASRLRVAAHATELEAARALVEMGADVLVHSVQDRDVDPAFVALLKEKHVPLIPTLVVLPNYAAALAGAPSRSPATQRYGAPRALQSFAELPLVADDATREALEPRRQRAAEAVPVMARNLRALHEAGVTIAAGTDAGNIGTLPGASIHDELRAMARAGMPNDAVLVAATQGGSQIFGPEADFGVIGAGKLADLLVLDGDPLADLQNLERVRYVVKGGVALRPDEILAPNPAWVVDRQIDAYNARDLDRFLSFYAPDASVADFPSGDVKMKDREAMRATYAKLFAENRGLRCRIVERIVHGSFVVDQELVTGIEGRPYLHGVATYEVKDGLIRRVSFLPRP